MKKEDSFFKEIAFEIDDVEQVNENIYSQFAKNMAKLVDIDFAKTPVVDLFTGYQRSFVLQQRIDEAIEYIKDKGCYEEDTKVFCDDINYDELSKLLDILQVNKEEE